MIKRWKLLLVIVILSMSACQEELPEPAVEIEEEMMIIEEGKDADVESRAGTNLL